jgi:fumarate reductase subunit C
MAGWWRRNPHHFLYMVREGTSVFVGAYAVVLLWALTALADGPDAWSTWLATMRHPLAVLFHLVVFVAACWHTVTWFAVSPKTMPPMRLGGRPVPASALVGGQYLAAIVTSGAILYAAAAAA